MMKTLKTYNQLFENRISIKNYLENGGDPNAGEYIGFSYLHAAALNGEYNNINLLLDAGADINITNNEGKTPLMYAVGQGKTKIVKLLIDRGADVDIVSYQNYMNALNLAGYGASFELICLLIDAGADWNIKTNTGDFIESVTRESILKKIIEKYPEKYKRYLMMKKAKEFNL